MGDNFDLRTTKLTDPQNDPQQFDFIIIDRFNDYQFSISGGQSQLTQNVFSGESDPITVTETVPPGWELVDISCSDVNNPVVDLENATVTLETLQNNNAQCTFTNRKIQFGQITINKKIHGKDDTFTFVEVDNKIEPFTITTKKCKGSTVLQLPVGDYTIREEPKSSWECIGIKKCDGVKTNRCSCSISFTITKSSKLDCTFVNKYNCKCYYCRKGCEEMCDKCDCY